MSEVVESGEPGRVVELANLPHPSLRSVPRADDEIPPVGQKRRDEVVVVVDVVFQVRILKQDHVARAHLQPRPHGMSLASGLVLQEEPHAWMRA